MEKIGEELSRIWGSVIIEAIESAYHDWRIAQSEVANHKKRTRASYVWDCAISRLRAALSTSQDFFFQDVGQTTYIIYRDTLRLQFKGCNARGRVSSVPTRRVAHFASQLPLDFEIYPHLTNVYLTYQLDPYETGIQTIILACPNGASYEWVIPIEDTAVSTMDLFDTNIHEASSHTGGRLKLKTRKDAGSVNGAV